ncbi:MAG: peptidyl-prolyl cis-trans isomerase [candidate division WOR-3 bacterium]|nr:MAG: peptidyl-prolyl cis-trans isomerase [candidate division WOR-3 bacterium]
MLYHRILFVVLFLFLVGCSNENKTVLTIGNSQYTVADFKEQIKFAPGEDSVRRMAKFEDYVNQMLVVEEAKAAGYEEDPVVKTAFETNRREVIWRSYYTDVILGKVKVSDKEVRDLYNKIIDQYHLAQIVVAEESLANHVSAELKKGRPFEELLAFSLDTLTENGDIGTFSAVSIPPEIMVSLKKVMEGGVTPVIEFGEYYMIFKVIEHTVAETPTFEEVRENIKDNIWQEKAREEGEKYFNRIMEQAKVEYNQEGLDILLKPESLLTEEDLNTWVVKKYDTSIVYVRSVIDAVRYLHGGSRADPKYLIDQELISDLIYDEAIKTYYDRRKSTKRKLRSTHASLMYQKYYSDKVLEKVVVDSAEVKEYYTAHRDEFKDREYSRAFSVARARVREAIIDSLRSDLFGELRDKYKPVVDETVLAQLLKEEK